MWTAGAIARRSPEDPLLVAELTRKIAMRAAQLVAGGQVVELGSLYGRCMRREQQGQNESRDGSPEHGCLPLARPRPSERSRVVALLALGAEAPGVDIVSRMTGSADHRGLDDVLRPDVAVGASDLRVRAQQGETGMGGMIEVPHLPTVWCMAFAAVLTETAVVDIVFCVTAVALLGGVSESLGGMTLAAGNHDMQPREGILRLIVIEPHFLPSGRVVALLALPAQRTSVRLVGAVAVDALRAEFLILHDTGMAYVTIESRVRALEAELEVRQVIEVGHPARGHSRGSRHTQAPAD